LLCIASRISRSIRSFGIVSLVDKSVG
jgi:hypothetical protein